MNRCKTTWNGINRCVKPDGHDKEHVIKWPHLVLPEVVSDDS